jgi:hypothetical protein
MATEIRDLANASLRQTRQTADNVRRHQDVMNESQAAILGLADASRACEKRGIFENIEVFDGTDKTHFNRWIQQLQYACHLVDRDDDILIEALSKSSGAVRSVLESLPKDYPWDDAALILRQGFSEDPTEAHASRKLHDITQLRNQSLREYCAEYKYVSERVSGAIHLITDPFHIDNFINSLYNQFIKGRVSKKDKYPTTLYDAMLKAQDAEAELQRREAYTASASSILAADTTIGSVHAVEGRLTAELRRANVQCFRCGMYGHYARECDQVLGQLVKEDAQLAIDAPDPTAPVAIDRTVVPSRPIFTPRPAPTQADPIVGELKHSMETTVPITRTTYEGMVRELTNQRNDNQKLRQVIATNKPWQRGPPQGKPPFPARAPFKGPARAAAIPVRAPAPAATAAAPTGGTTVMKVIGARPPPIPQPRVAPVVALEVITEDTLIQDMITTEIEAIQLTDPVTEDEMVLEFADAEAIPETLVQEEVIPTHDTPF